jgi:hypothetical protein
MSNLYKNPLTPEQLNGAQSVSRTETFGTNFSVLGIGGFMEVYNISDLDFTIPPATTGPIELSGNTIPISFLKGTGAPFSYDVLTLGSDNISSGRRRLGMLVYVYETNQVYQHTINNYESLWTAATAATSTVVISDFGTTINNSTTEGQLLIDAWTASTVEGISGVTRPTATWKKYHGTNLAITGGSYNSFTGTLNLVNITGGTVPITGISGGGGGGGGITGGTFNLSNGDLTLSSSAGTITIPGFLYGTGTTNTIPKYITSSGFTNSQITDDGINVTIGGNLTTISADLLVNQGITATTISATTYYNLPIDPDSYVTGFTLNSDIITLSQNRNDQYSAFTISLSAYTGGTGVSGDYLPLSGGTVTGLTNFNSGLTSNSITATTISATTYLNVPNYNAGLLNNSDQWINNNDGTVTLPSTYVSLYNQISYPSIPNVFLITSGTSGTEFPSLSNNDTNYIVVDYNGGNPTWDILTDNSTINGETIVLTHIIYRANNFLHVLDFGNEGIALPNKINDRIVAVDRFGRESGFSLGLSGSTGIVTLTGGIAWNGTNRQTLVPVNSQDDIFFQSYHTGGIWTYTTSANTLNNLYYDNGTNPVLATSGKYLVNWYFRGQEINDHLYEVWGNDEYDNVSEAQLSTEPNLPELITSHAFLTGRIIVQVSATTGVVESAFVQVFQPSTVQAHNDLTGIQGGSINEYYHLTSSQYNNLSSFKNIQINGVTQFSSTTLTDSLNFSGINVNILSGAGNTLIFSAGTGGGGGGGTTVTGGTYSAGTLTINSSDSSSVSITGFPSSTYFGVSVDGSGGVITTGQKGYVKIPYNFTITSWTIIGTPSGTLIFDVWKANNTLPTVANTIITGGTKPTLSGSTLANSSSVSGWYVDGLANDIIGWYVDSATTVTNAVLQIYVTRIN